MRLLYVNTLLDRVSGGGIAERAAQLCGALVKAGTDCTILTLDIGLDAARRSELAGITLRALPCLNRRFQVPAIWPAEIWRAVASSDVIELASYWTLLNVWVYFAARAQRKPYLVTPAGALLTVGRSAIMKGLYRRLVGRQMIRHAAAAVAITVGELPAFEFYGVNPKNVVVIPNGVHLSGEESPNCDGFRARFGIDAKFIILFMGRLSFIKGPDLLLEAFGKVVHKLPTHHLVFAGPDDGMLDQLQAFAEEHGISKRVHFLGYLSGKDKECAYRACDFLAVPSRKEAMSIVALEAGIRGKPVLITDQCGFAEIELAGGGRVVAANTDAIAQALVAEFSDAPALAGMGRALMQFVRDQYTWEHSAALHKRLCEQILSRN